MNAAVSASLADLAISPARWFSVRHGTAESECTMAVLALENPDDIDLAEWAETAAVGAVFRTGGAAGEVSVERTA